MVGYSGKALVQKIGLKAGHRLALAGEPKQFVRFGGAGHENLGSFGAIETARQFINGAKG